MKILEIGLEVVRVEQMVYCSKEGKGDKVLICDPEGNVIRNPVSHEETTFLGQEAALFIFDLPVKDGFYVTLWQDRIYNNLLILMHPLTVGNESGEEVDAIFEGWIEDEDECEEKLRPFRAVIKELRSHEGRCYHCELIAPANC